MQADKAESESLVPVRPVSMSRACISKTQQDCSQQLHTSRVDHSSILPDAGQRKLFLFDPESRHPSGVPISTQRADAAQKS